MNEKDQDNISTKRRAMRFFNDRKTATVGGIVRDWTVDGNLPSTVDPS
jgi:hypothetical protein